MHDVVESKAGRGMGRADLRDAPAIVAETLVVVEILIVAAAVVLAVALDLARA